jgi:hypothetical protein
MPYSRARAFTKHCEGTGNQFVFSRAAPVRPMCLVLSVIVVPPWIEEPIFILISKNPPLATWSR